jgi:hypothetical protein
MAIAALLTRATPAIIGTVSMASQRVEGIRSFPFLSKGRKMVVCKCSPTLRRQLTLAQFIAISPLVGSHAWASGNGCDKWL